MQYYSHRNLEFLLYEVFNIEQLNQYEYFADHNKETYDLVLKSCADIGSNHLQPIVREMDIQPPTFENGRILVHPHLKKIMQIFGEGGWINAPHSYEEGGQQMPYMIFNSTMFIWGAANYSATAFPFLTAGASNLIRSFASKELQSIYLDNMYQGKWQGTMALTEPEAGSSLGDIITTASPTEEGHYLIKGQKIFISCGDQDATENIVHLMLARIEGAPKGSKGISLFIVPRLRPNQDGNLTYNDVATAGLFHKMGYRGAPIAHLMMGEKNDCHGYLIGEPNRGLHCMFQMMNEARIAVGFNATSIASAAYYASLHYCKERKQGRKMGTANKEQSLIIEHADVKRLLLFQKAIVEGSLGLLMECSYYADLCRVCTSKEEKQKYEALLGLLTPIAKSYPAEMGCLTTSAAIQCLGGFGFTEEYMPELFYREARIHPIHEGTTAIHGMDLLGRKIIKDQGQALRLLVAEIQKTIESALAQEALKPLAEQLAVSIEKLSNTTMNLGALAMQGQHEKFLADASLYLEAFGIVVIAWQWLKQGLVATQANQDDFYKGKVQTMQYYFAYELPKTRGLLATLNQKSGISVTMQAEWF